MNNTAGIWKFNGLIKLVIKTASKNPRTAENYNLPFISLKLLNLRLKKIVYNLNTT